MKVIEAIEQHASDYGIRISVEMPFSRKEFNFDSQDLDKMKQNEEFAECLNMNIKGCRIVHALCMVIIEVSEPGTEIYDYQYRLSEEAKRGFRIDKRVNYHNKVAEFACKVCHKKMKRDHPESITCAFRGIDDEYCPDLLKALEEFNHENRTM